MRPTVAFSFSFVSRLLLYWVLLGFSILGAPELHAQENVNIDSLKKVISERKDSMMLANQKRVDSIKAANAARMDSIREYNNRRLDSIKSARAEFMDSLRRERERRADSLAAIEKYRNSRHYKDSIAAVKKEFRDSITNARLERLDSMKKRQLEFKDSMKVANEARRDSIEKVVQARRDSLMKKRDELIAAREKKKEKIEKLTEEEKKKKAKAEIHEKKKEAYDNSKFLKKKWSFPRSALQNTYTRYNYYYNAQLIYHDMLEKIYKQQVTNFDSLISVYRIDYRQAKKFAGKSPEQIIKKASLDIQMHDPRSKWQDDLYYLIAKAYYYQQDFDKAVPYLKFIIKNFNVDEEKSKKKKKGRQRQKQLVQKVKTKDGKTKRVISIATEEPKGFSAKLKHRPIRNDALMLLARSYSDEGYNAEALSLLTQLEKDVNFPERLRSELNMLKTQIYMNEESYDQSQHYLQFAIEESQKKNEKARLYFLEGQLMQAAEKIDSAYLAFQQVDDKSSDLDIATNAKFKMADIVYAQKDKSKTAGLEKKFTKMLREEKYEDTKGDIFFHLGTMYLVDGKIDDAEESFTESIAQAGKPENKIKAISQLVSFYYEADQHAKADFYYKMMPEENEGAEIPGVPSAEILDTLAKAQSQWQHSDSMLYMATLSKNQQKQWAKSEAAKEAALKDTLNDGFQKLSPNSSASSGGRFYFSNPSLISKGEKEFIQQWGRLNDVDNWAIKSLMPSQPTGTDVPVAEGPSVQADPSLTGTEKYMAMIPVTEEQRSQYRFAAQDAIFKLGEINYKLLNRPRKANQYFDTLLSTYPLTEFRPRALFDLYVTTQVMGDTAMSMNYRNILEKEYPGSFTFIFDEYVDGKGEKKEDSARLAYERMYQEFKKESYPEFIHYYTSNYKYVQNYPYYLNKAKLLQSQALAGKGEYQNALGAVDDLIAAEPDSDVLDFALDFQKALQKKLGMEVKTEEPKMEFKTDLTEPSVIFIRLYEAEKVQTSKIYISNFNMKNFPDAGYRVSERYIDSSVYLTVYTFQKFTLAQEYLEALYDEDPQNFLTQEGRLYFIVNSTEGTRLKNEKQIEQYYQYYMDKF